MRSIDLKQEKSAPFVDLRSDAGFKAVLADRNNKDILIGVLNEILPPEAMVEDIVEYSDREQRRDVVYGKKTVLDLVCVDRFISYWQFIEKRTGEVANQTISVIFVEMALFTKSAEECVTESDRLFYIFRNGGGFERIPEWIEESDGVSRRLAEACEVAAFSKEKKLKYEVEKMNERDIRAQRKYAERVSREEGRAEGEAMTKARVAKSMLQENMPVEQIARLTGLSESEVRAL